MLIDSLGGENVSLLDKSFVVTAEIVRLMRMEGGA